MGDSRFILLCLAAFVVSLEPADAKLVSNHRAFMPLYGETAPIESHVKFCQRLPQECEEVPGVAERMHLDAARLSELDEINRFVNGYIVPTPQTELYGVRDYWAYPDQERRGDCNSYVLLKRKLLMMYGWPPGDLLITVVFLKNGEGHAILTARTDTGDLVLDNLDANVRPWYEAPYTFVMRQSYLDPKTWMALAPDPLHPQPILADTATSARSTTGTSKSVWQTKH